MTPSGEFNLDDMSEEEVDDYLRPPSPATNRGKSEAPRMPPSMRPDYIPNEFPDLPPQSNHGKFQHRKSRSKTYNKRTLEWKWQLHDDMPELWIRDIDLLTMDTFLEWRRSWKNYKKLRIAGTGDGAGLNMRLKSERIKLEAEYSMLEPRVRRAKEVALARYDPFAIRATDGTLDYHTAISEPKERRSRRRKKKAACVTM